jgi:hypothetical protein
MIVLVKVLSLLFFIVSHLFLGLQALLTYKVSYLFQIL